jgi:hypothetical protein
MKFKTFEKDKRKFGRMENKKLFKQYNTIMKKKIAKDDKNRVKKRLRPVANRSLSIATVASPAGVNHLLPHSTYCIFYQNHAISINIRVFSK